jgi:putative hydrolase of the HAD superfamily
MTSPSIRVVFFDIGDTLVVSADRSWVPGAKAVLAELRARGLRRGVISNTDGLSRSQLAPILPDDFDWDEFDPPLVILSAEVGVEKPSPQIFQLAVAASGVAAAACLFCTEELPHTLVAQRVGLLAARVQPPPHSDVGDLVSALDAAGVLG